MTSSGLSQLGHGEETWKTSTQTHTRSPPGHFYHQPVNCMIIFSTVVNHFWTPTDTDKWLHTRAFPACIHRQPCDIHTHTWSALLYGCEWGNKVSIHQWRLYEWNNCLCTGSTDSVTSHLLDRIPERFWQPSGCDWWSPEWWGHTCGCLVYSVGTWWRLSTRSSRGLAATVAKVRCVHASCRLTIHVFSNNKTHSHFFAFFSYSHFTVSCPHSLSPAHTHTHTHTLTLHRQEDKQWVILCAAVLQWAQC